MGSAVKEAVRAVRPVEERVAEVRVAAAMGSVAVVERLR